MKAMTKQTINNTKQSKDKTNNKQHKAKQTINNTKQSNTKQTINNTKQSNTKQTTHQQKITDKNLKQNTKQYDI